MQCWVVATQLPRLVDRMHSQVGRGRAELEGESRTREQNQRARAARLKARERKLTCHHSARPVYFLALLATSRVHLSQDRGRADLEGGGRKVGSLNAKTSYNVRYRYHPVQL